MQPDELTRLVEKHYPATTGAIRNDIDPGYAERLFRELALTPAPSGCIAELSITQRRIISGFGWDPRHYKVTLNPKGQVTIIFGDLDKKATDISFVPHGDQISFVPDVQMKGWPGYAHGRDKSKNYLQVYPSHKWGLKKGDSVAAAMYAYNPTRYSDACGTHPGLDLLVRGMVRCVRRPHRNREKLTENEPSPFVFEYEGNIEIHPEETVIIFDNEHFYDPGDLPVIEAACADDRAGVAASLLAAKLLYGAAVQEGMKIVINCHCNEEGPADGVMNWADDAAYGNIRAIMRNKEPAPTAIVIDGHVVKENTRLGVGALYALRTGAGKGSKTPVNLGAFLRLAAASSDLGVRLDLNQEYVSRSSDVELKYYQNLLVIGYPIDRPT